MTKKELKELIASGRMDDAQVQQLKNDISRTGLKDIQLIYGASSGNPIGYTSSLRTLIKAE